MDTKLKVGVVGLGILGNGYIKLFRETPTVKVIALADIRETLAKSLGTEIGAQAYSDFKTMFKEQKLDVAVIATPDPLHKEPVLAAIKSGVPAIIQEKPMATSVEDAETMLNAAEQARSRIFVNYANRGSSEWDAATYYVIRQGLLGKLIHGEVGIDDHVSLPLRMWGERSQEWVTSSSIAHFLLSHIVDYLRWLLSPSEVTEVYAISQKQVLKSSPDLYDAFLTFDNDSKFRVRVAWIKHIEGLVEFRMTFSGSEGTLIYIKRPGFGEVEGWRANLSNQVTREDLIAHSEQLVRQGINVSSVTYRPNFKSTWMGNAIGDLSMALEGVSNAHNWWRLTNCFIDAVLQDTLCPTSWSVFGPLPTGHDGLEQTRVVCAVIKSAEDGCIVKCR